MKRLIKKSQLYTAFNYYSNYFEVFKNPSYKEISDTKNSDPHGGIRGVIYDDGTMFIWPGEIWHTQMRSISKEPIDIDQFRFSYEDNHGWFIDSSRYTGEQTLELIKKYKNVLQQVGDINGNYSIRVSDNSINLNMTGMEIFK